uniref:Secreted protein n=1 Tax=Macrostomum lignano TaxID=282301 RepID=A0A1I8FH16_9PLAT
ARIFSASAATWRARPAGVAAPAVAASGRQRGPNRQPNWPKQANESTNQLWQLTTGNRSLTVKLALLTRLEASTIIADTQRSNKDSSQDEKADKEANLTTSYRRRTMASRPATAAVSTGPYTPTLSSSIPITASRSGRTRHATVSADSDITDPRIYPTELNSRV